MRQIVIAGNWKMFHSPSQTTQVLTDLIPLLHAGPGAVQAILFPPFISLPAAISALRGTNVELGAQNLHHEHQGAFTGEISAPMIADLGCQYVLIGHSERRQYFGETNASTQQKMQAAIQHALIPILCVGETLDQREANQTMTLIAEQLTQGLAGISPQARFMIAYEPVWAIGTGKVATPEQAQDVHAYIRQTLQTLGFSAEKVQILYGGSVKPDNIAALLQKSDIDGALVGGASLEAKSFAALVQIASEIPNLKGA